MLKRKITKVISTVIATTLILGLFAGDADIVFAAAGAEELTDQIEVKEELSSDVIEPETEEADMPDESVTDTEDAVQTEDIDEPDMTDTDTFTVSKVDKIFAADSIIFADKKGTIEEAIAMLPATWKVTFKDGSKKKVSVSWTCMDNFDDNEYSSFVFMGKIDDKRVSEVTDKKADRKLRMEIVFAGSYDRFAGGEDAGIKELKLSLNTLFGVAEEAAKNSSSDIVLGKSKLNISKSAYDTFKKISGRNRSYVYKKLSKKEKKYYNKIDNTINSYLYYGKEPNYISGIAVTKGVKADLSAYDAMNVAELYAADNPQVFFIAFILGDERTNTHYYVFLPDTDTPKKIKNAAEKIAKNLNAAAKSVNNQKGDYKKAKKAQEVICRRLTLDEESELRVQKYESEQVWSNMTEGNYFYETSIISAFLKNKGKAAHLGYTDSYLALARLAGLDVMTVLCPSLFRVYNKVKVNGKWYNLAPSYEKKKSKGCTYKYFLKSDSKMKKLNPALIPNEDFEKYYPKCPKNY